MNLAVKPAYALISGGWLPTRLKGSLRASVTFWRATAPVNCPKSPFGHLGHLFAMWFRLESGDAPPGEAAPKEGLVTRVKS